MHLLRLVSANGICARTVLQNAAEAFADNEAVLAMLGGISKALGGQVSNS
jgi:hypothetical protein